ncbi:bacterio-opsin activator domain-containing protein [Haloarcula sediminis]|uniref:bacterio-opsin activator domain-containing protein n=1 Tax=Haloarcula sediminis TaxID=3111777 RepID=UPI002D792552|nr:bacterio-opsin activator domain-containing protein [Haloarcula sp. CK38]
MSVITEMTVDSGEFLLGTVLSRDPEADIELERAIPATDQVMPYIWVTGRELPDFESRVRTSPHVRRLAAVDVVNNQGLYRIEWADDGESLVHGLSETGATILNARGAGTWEFLLQFDDYGGLARFHNYCRRRGIGISLDRVYSPEGIERADEDGLRTEL